MDKVDEAGLTAVVSSGQRMTVGRHRSDEAFAGNG